MRDERGQATVELVGVLPLVAVLALLSWQAVVAGDAVWRSGAAARAAARASAVGGDPARAARRVVARARVDEEATGSVTVTVPIPAVVGGIRLARIERRARFAPQVG
jgi:uncharacterized membrane protein